MYKKLILIVVVLAIVALVGYVKLCYQNSQWQLKRDFRFVSAMPIEHFYNAAEKSCGIWYERIAEGGTVEGRANQRVMKCFENAFNNCEPKNILLVKENDLAPKASLIYSLIRVIKQNDQNECIIQNYNEEHALDLGQEKQPLSFINTCTVLSDKYYNSCEPLYIKDTKQKLESGEVQLKPAE